MKIKMERRRKVGNARKGKEWRFAIGKCNYPVTLLVLVVTGSTGSHYLKRKE